jgi:TPR repeat protein
MGWVYMSEPAGQFGHDERWSDPPADAGSADAAPSDAAHSDAGPAEAGRADAAPADALPYPHCSRCQADLAHCFLSARFCPRCGMTLADLSETAARPARLPPPLPLPVLAVEPREAGGDTHALILGYANAMFRLGWHYENGGGVSRNAEEAVRCYFKAAKLGNGSARARLTTQDPHEPDPPGGSGAPVSG